MKTLNCISLAALITAALFVLAPQAMAQKDATWKGRGMPEGERFAARRYYPAPRMAVAPAAPATEIAVAERPSTTERRTFSAEPARVTPPMAAAPQVRRTYTYEPARTYRQPVSTQRAPAREKYELQKADPRKFE